MIGTGVVPRIVFGRHSWNVSDELIERVSPYHICSDNVSPAASSKYYLWKTFVTINKLELDSFKIKNKKFSQRAFIWINLKLCTVNSKTSKIIKSDLSYIYILFLIISRCSKINYPNCFASKDIQPRRCCPLMLLTLSSKAANDDEAISRIFCCEFNCSSYEATSALDNSLSTGVLSKRPRGIAGAGEPKFLNNAGLLNPSGLPNALLPPLTVLNGSGVPLLLEP